MTKQYECGELVVVTWDEENLKLRPATVLGRKVVDDKVLCQVVGVANYLWVPVGCVRRTSEDEEEAPQGQESWQERLGQREPTIQEEPAGGGQERSDDEGPARVSERSGTEVSALLMKKLQGVMRQVNEVAQPVVAHGPDRLTRRGGEHVIVRARAGTGKTTTLVEGMKRVKGMGSSLTPSPQQELVWKAMEESLGVNSIGFVAFNSSIAEELKRRVPQGCDAMTMHSMGFKAVTRRFGLSGRDIVNKLRVSELASRLLGRDMRDVMKERPRFLGVSGSVQQVVKFCKMRLVGVDDHNRFDVKATDWGREIDKIIDHYDIDVNSDRDRDDLYKLVPALMEACLDPSKDGCIDFDDQIWLPIVDPGIRLWQYDLLCVDEAQDLNPAQQQLVQRAGKRLIVVGDDKQCQPADTLVTLAGVPGNRWHPAIPGRRVRIEELKKGDVVVAYSPTDGRNYSNRVVEEIKARPYDGPIIEIETEEGVVSRYTPDHKCYATFGPLRDCFCVYLMRRGSQYRIGSCQINYGKSGNGLTHRLRTEGGEAAWLIEVHESKREARLREMELSHRYNLPQVVFPSAANDQGYILDEEGVTRFWEYVGDNSEVGRTVLQICGLSEDRPIAVPGELYQQSFKRPALFAACNLRSGMQVRTEEGRWVTIVVRRGHYQGVVYSLKVSHEELYMADGIVTHNSIYGFTGADTDGLPNMERMLTTTRGCVMLPLTVTRRCGKAIVEEAKKLVPDFEAHESNGPGKVLSGVYPLRKKRDGNYWTGGGSTERLPWDKTYLKDVQPGDLVICRVNSHLVMQCTEHHKRGNRAFILGREYGDQYVAFVEGMEVKDVPSLVAKVSDWRQAELTKEQAKRNPSDGRILNIESKADTILALSEGMNSMSELIQRVRDLFVADPNRPGVLHASIHKVKGLEAKNVFFLMPHGVGPPHPMAKSSSARQQEQNLLYVGTTRAIDTLTYVS